MNSPITAFSSLNQSDFKHLPLCTYIRGLTNIRASLSYVHKNFCCITRLKRGQLQVTSCLWKTDIALSYWSLRIVLRLHFLPCISLSQCTARLLCARAHSQAPEMSPASARDYEPYAAPTYAHLRSIIALQTYGRQMAPPQLFIWDTFLHRGVLRHVLIAVLRVYYMFLWVCASFYHSY